MRFILSKVGRSLLAKNIKFAIQEAKIIRLKLIIDNVQDKRKRKKVKKDMNRLFAELQNLNEARIESASKKALKKAKTTTKVTKKTSRKPQKPVSSLPYEIVHTDFTVQAVFVEK